MKPLFGFFFLIQRLTVWAEALSTAKVANRERDATAASAISVTREPIPAFKSATLKSTAPWVRRLVMSP